MDNHTQGITKKQKETLIIAQLEDFYPVNGDKPSKAELDSVARGVLTNVGNEEPEDWDLRQKHYLQINEVEDICDRYLKKFDNGARAVEVEGPEKLINCIHVSDFLNMEIPPREYILEPWLPTQGLAMVFSYRGVGKTFFGLSVAYAAATGGEFLNWKAPQRRNVLYIDGEMPAIVMQERLRQIIPNGADVPMLIITPDLQTMGSINLADEVDQVVIEQYLEMVDLIIVDNISTLCARVKDNQTDSWMPMQGWLLQQRMKGRTVLLFHHAGKSGDQRGTSSREDVLDTVIKLQRPAGYTSEDGAKFDVHFDKHRGFYGDDAKSFQAKLTTDERGDLMWTMSDIEDTNYEKVVELANLGMSVRDIIDETKIPRSSVYRALKNGREIGDIRPPGNVHKISKFRPKPDA